MALRPENWGQFPAARAAGPCGQHRGRPFAARGQQGCFPACGRAQPEHRHRLAAQRGRQGRPGRVPGAARVGEDPGHPGPAAAARHQRRPRGAERGGCEPGPAGRPGPVRQPPATSPSSAWSTRSRPTGTARRPPATSPMRLPVPGPAASASGTSARPPAACPVTQWAPSSAVLVSGEYVMFWLGRKAAVMDRPAGWARMKPPLLAMPGGVTSCHRADMAGLDEQLPEVVVLAG